MFLNGVNGKMENVQKKIMVKLLERLEIYIENKDVVRMEMLQI